MVSGPETQSFGARKIIAMHTATVTDYTNECVGCQAFYEKKVTRKTRITYFFVYGGRFCGLLPRLAMSLT
jgi:hypothetical protein